MPKQKGSYDFVKDLRTHHQVLFAVVVGVGMVAFWRGVWGLMDVFIMPDNKFLSSVISIKIGLLILVGLHVIVSEFVRKD